MKKIENPAVRKVFNDYPDNVRPIMMYLRQLILDTAAEIGTVDDLEETLKWGEPSYLTKTGSTIRMDYKIKSPDQYALYFKCTTKLIPTFKLKYGDLFSYEKTRALVFKLNDTIPIAELKSCISTALTYHLVKDLPDLDM